MMIPTAPANRCNLKTWTPAQLTYAAPFWVAKLEAWLVDDDALIAQCPANSQLLVDALGIKKKHKEQLTFWKLVISDRIFRVRPHSLRTHHRNGSAKTHRGTAARRDTTVGNWDKADGIWPK
jgi:hypothetical protein